MGNEAAMQSVGVGGERKCALRSVVVRKACGCLSWKPEHCLQTGAGLSQVICIDGTWG